MDVRNIEMDGADLEKPPSGQQLEGIRSNTEVESIGSSVSDPSLEEVVDDGLHRITFAVTVAVRFPTYIPPEPKEKTSPSLTPTAVKFFHCACTLFPEDEESIKSDVVIFYQEALGCFAKIYAENQEAQIGVVWVDGASSWVAWKVRAKAVVTAEWAPTLVDHCVDVRLWDTKEKMTTTKAKSDKPKTFKIIPDTREGIEEKMRNTIHDMAKNFERTTMPRLPTNTSLPRLPHIPHSPSMIAAEAAAAAVEESMHDQRQTKFAEPQVANETPKKPEGISSRASVRSRKSTKSGKSAKSKSKSRTPSKEKSRQSSASKGNESRTGAQAKDAEERTRREKFGIVGVGVSMAPFFANECRQRTNRIQASVDDVQDMFAQVSIDGPLLSTEQRTILNPLVIDVRFVRNLPPLPLHQSSKNQHAPTFISYKFPTLQRRTRVGTKLAKSSRDYAWDDVHVIFTNQLHETRLREIFMGSPLRIEIHDRDRILEETSETTGIPGKTVKITEFGKNAAEIPTQQPSSSTPNDPFYRPRRWEASAFAHLDLTPLVLGQRFFEVSAQLQSTSPPDPMPRNAKLNLKEFRKRLKSGKASREVFELLDTRETSQLVAPMAQYLETDSQVDIRVELARQLRPLQSVTNAGIRVAEVEQKPESSEEETNAGPEACQEGEAGEEATALNEAPAVSSAQTGSVDNMEENAVSTTTASSTPPPPQPNAFSRMLIKFVRSNKTFMLKLHRLISEINAKALLEEVENLPDYVIALALLERHLTEEERKSPDLDYISGFHFWDNEIQMVVIEGIAEKGMALLWTDLNKMMEEEANFAVLYNSSVTFAERKYGREEVDLLRVGMRYNLLDFATNSLTFARGLWKRRSFDAINKLTELLFTSKIRDVCHRDLFISIESLDSLQAEVGSNLTENDFVGFQTAIESTSSTTQPLEEQSPPPPPKTPSLSSKEQIEARNLWLEHRSKGKSSIELKSNSGFGHKCRHNSDLDYRNDPDLDCRNDLDLDCENTRNNKNQLLAILCLDLPPYAKPQEC